MPKKEKKVSKFANNPFDFTLCITVLILLSLGIVMVLSASSPSALAIEGNSYAYVTRQAGCAVIGIIAMFVISKIDYRFYKKYYKLIYFVGVVILLMVLIPGIGVKVNGAKRWIKLGIQFQPSEITKIALIIFFAAYISNNKEKFKGIWNSFLKPFLFLAPPILILVLVQDHLSASVVIIAVVSVMMLVAGTKLVYFLTAGLIGRCGRSCRIKHNGKTNW